MGYSIFTNFNFMLVLCLFLASLIVSPEIYSVLALSLSKKWLLLKSKMIPGKNREPGKKMRRYWEIEVKKLR